MATEIRSGPGSQSPAPRACWDWETCVAHHLRTSSALVLFYHFGEFGAEFGPVSTLLGNFRGREKNPKSLKSENINIMFWHSCMK